MQLFSLITICLLLSISLVSGESLLPVENLTYANLKEMFAVARVNEYNLKIQQPLLSSSSNGTVQVYKVSITKEVYASSGFQKQFVKCRNVFFALTHDSNHTLYHWLYFVLRPDKVTQLQPSDFTVNKKIIKPCYAKKHGKSSKKHAKVAHDGKVSLTPTFTKCRLQLPTAYKLANTTSHFFGGQVNRRLFPFDQYLDTCSLARHQETLFEGFCAPLPEGYHQISKKYSIQLFQKCENFFIDSTTLYMLYKPTDYALYRKGEKPTLNAGGGGFYPCYSRKLRICTLLLWAAFFTLATVLGLVVSLGIVKYRKKRSRALDQVAKVTYQANTCEVGQTNVAFSASIPSLSVSEPVVLNGIKK